MVKKINQTKAHQVTKPTRPLYMLAKEKILSMTQEGVFPVGSQLPAEPELASILGVSRATLREALQSLAEDGIVTAIQGKGTFVNANWLFTYRTLNRLQSTGEMARAFKLGLIHRLRSFKEESADAVIARQLDVPVGTPIIVLERLWYQEDVPIIYSIDSFPRSVADFEEYGPDMFSGEDFSLFAFLEENLGLEISWGIATIMPVLDAGEICPDLAQDGKTAFLLLEQVHYLSDDTPVLYCKDFLRGDSLKVRVMRKR